MNEASKISYPATSEASPNVISSPASECGLALSDKRDGPMTDRFGLEVAHANLSASPENVEGRKTGVICGPYGSNSLITCAPPSSSESKSRRRGSLEKRLMRDRVYQLRYRLRHRAKDLVRHAK